MFLPWPCVALWKSQIRLLCACRCAECHRQMSHHLKQNSNWTSRLHRNQWRTYWLDNIRFWQSIILFQYPVRHLDLLQLWLIYCFAIIYQRRTTLSVRQNAGYLHLGQSGFDLCPNHSSVWAYRWARVWLHAEFPFLKVWC